ncbi:helix-turn-helix transcriptional regulator [Crossiella sp. SN42]|uniref:winged helix-turn-helix transcriptional regulator n=1 Tax=Crossiella sp. SN42 TaxID=2944808 RepID=UPI00207D1EFA|nr:helix-turn-helix domain-containing protein [Crossiella sp. SN42]MCO1575232.1 helix-turn-helix transcriptional regulator [Crossiella sp. SN42]
MTQVIGRQARCAIARGVDLLGDKWALLIAREACWGRTRFSEFRRNLGIAPDVLANRLAALVHEGVLERRAYRDTGARAREEYVLTPAGHDLLLVLAGLAHWGREHRPLPESSSPVYTDADTGEQVELCFVTKDGRRVELDRVDAGTGPAE